MNQFVEKYGQILLPLITPYDANEEVDYGKYAELIEYLIQNDLCDSLIVTGTTGEASLLTFDERVKLMETAVKTAAGRKPVIAGTGCASTKETIALTNKAMDLGIETCLVVCPFYNKPTQEGLYRHFKALAEATKADIMLYNIPIFVGVNLEAETVRRLAALQRSILENASQAVKPGGRLVYSTCSIDAEEDGLVVRDFLQNHPEWTLKEEKLILPHEEKSDGAYAALLICA